VWAYLKIGNKSRKNQLIWEEVGVGVRAKGDVWCCVLRVKIE
jgi:hypothetical protein